MPRNRHRHRNQPNIAQHNLLFNAWHGVLGVINQINLRPYANMATTTLSNVATASLNYLTNTVTAPLNYVTKTVTKDNARNGAMSLVTNSWNLPYNCTSFMYSAIDEIFPMYDEYGELSAIHANLKLGATVVLVMAASTPWIALAALGYNYQAAKDNLAENSLYEELKALGSGDVPKTQYLPASQHWRSCLCSVGALATFGLPGMIIASLINSNLQSAPNAQKQQELQYFIDEADTREKGAKTRLSTDPTFTSLPPQARATIARLIPAFAEFSHLNDNSKMLEGAAAASLLLRKNLEELNIGIRDHVAQSLISTILQVPASPAVSAVITHANHNGNYAGGPHVDSNKVEKLAETFASRLTKITTERSRG